MNANLSENSNVLQSVPPARARLLSLLVIELGLAISLASGGGEGPISIDVPFVEQRPHLCAVASISMVTRYWDGLARAEGHRATDAPERCAAARYSSDARGISGQDVSLCFEDNGYRAFIFEGEWSDLADHLLKGRPIIVCLGARGGGRGLHYVVVTGIDASGRHVWVNDPAVGKGRRLTRSAFERRWHASGNWAILAIPASGP
jgi:ABC-type bacteriocin/lantibiotic exporter with double-glycine peptidase domain